MISIDPELLARHDRPGPRYTSYPTAVDFDESVGPEEHRAGLRRAGESGRPLSVYVHLPFCAARCSFCACHVVVTSRTGVADAYLGRLVAEAELVAEALGDVPPVVQYHWGGGTPTHHDPSDLRALHGALMERFPLADDAEVAIEVDPRVTTVEHLEVLVELGFNRISLGVQDLDPGVQEAIGRNQTEEQTRELFDAARALGFGSINLDLVYGLPGQDGGTLERTLASVVEMSPERLAVYSFAWVPWMRPHQRRIDESALPGRDEKFELLARVVTTLTGAGYAHIGMDHFALPGDELVVAASDGTLTRNFMGYTTRGGTNVVALGTSGISDVEGGYSQGHRRLASYYDMVDRGVLPIERGYLLDEDDVLRRTLITELMCNGAYDLGSVPGWERRFARELEALLAPAGLVDEGLAVVDGSVVRATELGRLFVRRLAAVFDAHGRRRAAGTPMFSRTV